MNTPESELFRKGAVVYGLDKARAAIAREDRACIVEGNTDVIALHQAGLEPVVASMGTALTEAQLKELGRLSKRLWLAFDGDAAGETATLRGMELAAKQGFDVKVVALPPGVDPPTTRAGSSSGSRSPIRTCSTAFGSRSSAPTTARRPSDVVRTLLDEAGDSPERQDAWRYANDKLGMTVQLRAGRRVGSRGRRSVAAGDRCERTLERDAIAGVLAHEQLRPSWPS